MTPEQFFSEFGHIAEAPNGIHKLRELILSLAVRGKLVSQDSSDEPASKQMERIQAEKARLLNEKKIKKSESLSPITEGELPYKLPRGWEWVRLGEIINISSGDGLTSEKMAKSGTIPVYGGNGITGYHDKYNVEKPTIVIGRVGYYCGSIHLTESFAWITDNAFITTFSEDNIFRDYLIWILKGTNLKERENATAQPVISGKKVYPLIVGLPPLAEQLRIAAKVDQLMSLCDELENRQQKKQKKLIRLNNASLDQLTNAREAVDFTTAWQLVRDNFDLLYTTPETIAKLRQSILQLAVQGKLVSQNPNDEPATVLLERIRTEKERLVKEKMIRKSEPLSPVSADEVLYELPQGWEWVRLGNIGEVCGGGTPSKDNSEYWSGCIPWISPKDMKTGRIFSSELSISQKAVDNSSVRLIPAESILIVARSGILKRTLPVCINNMECTVNQDIKVLIPHLPKITNYLQVLLKGFEAIILEKLVKGGMTVQSLLYSEFCNYSAPCSFTFINSGNFP